MLVAKPFGRVQAEAGRVVKEPQKSRSGREGPERPGRRPGRIRDQEDWAEARRQPGEPRLLARTPDAGYLEPGWPGRYGRPRLTADRA